jgi:ABC-type sugar transport system substrate-binding protein
MAHRNRLRRPTITRVWMFLIPVASIAVTMAALLLARLSFDTVLGIAGLVFGLVTLAMSELRERNSPTKQVVFIGQDDAVFNQNIVQGMNSVLTGAMPYKSTFLTLPDAVTKTVDWQVSVLNSDTVDRADAVVILPGGDDERIWQALLRLSSQGTVVVVVDFEPPAHLFVNQRLQPPLFVASDFGAGGLLAGELTARHLAANPATKAIVCIGPNGSRPGTGRSSQVLYAIARHGLTGRVLVHELSSWDSKSATSELTALITQELAHPDRRLVVFCGDDRILIAISWAGATHPDWNDRLALIGYDGIQDADGRYVAQNVHFFYGTVDTQPVSQGSAVGRALVNVYLGDELRNPPSTLVAPQLVEAQATP